MINPSKNDQAVLFVTQNGAAGDVAPRCKISPKALAEQYIELERLLFATLGSDVERVLVLRAAQPATFIRCRNGRCCCGRNGT
jgi:hypothetical protein